MRRTLRSTTSVPKPHKACCASVFAPLCSSQLVSSQVGLGPLVVTDSCHSAFPVSRPLAVLLDCPVDCHVFSRFRFFVRMEIEKLNRKYVLLLQHWLVIALLFVLVPYSLARLCLLLLSQVRSPQPLTGLVPTASHRFGPPGLTHTFGPHSLSHRFGPHSLSHRLVPTASHRGLVPTVLHRFGPPGPSYVRSQQFVTAVPSLRQVRSPQFLTPSVPTIRSLNTAPSSCFSWKRLCNLLPRQRPSSFCTQEVLLPQPH